MDLFTWALIMIFPASLLCAAVFDLTTMTIPNKISLVLIAGFLTVAALTSMPWNLFFHHFAVALIMLVSGFLLFSFGIFGGGDAKLLASASLWLGWPLTGTFLIYTALFGGLLALFIVIFRKVPLPRFLRLEFLMRLHDPKEGAPYGIAIAVAGLLVFINSNWMQII